MAVCVGCLSSRRNLPCAILFIMHVGRGGPPSPGGTPTPAMAVPLGSAALFGGTADGSALSSAGPPREQCRFSRPAVLSPTGGSAVPHRGQCRPKEGAVLSKTGGSAVRNREQCCSSRAALLSRRSSVGPTPVSEICSYLAICVYRARLEAELGVVAQYGSQDPTCERRPLDLFRRRLSLIHI